MHLVLILVMSLLLVGVVTCQLKMNHPEIAEYLQEK